MMTEDLDQIRARIENTTEIIENMSQTCSSCNVETFGVIHKIEMYWKNRRDEPRIYGVCDRCFDSVQDILQGELS